MVFNNSLVQMLRMSTRVTTILKSHSGARSSSISTPLGYCFDWKDS